MCAWISWLLLQTKQPGTELAPSLSHKHNRSEEHIAACIILHHHHDCRNSFTLPGHPDVCIVFPMPRPCHCFTSSRGLLTMSFQCSSSRPLAYMKGPMTTRPKDALENRQSWNKEGGWTMFSLGTLYLHGKYSWILPHHCTRCKASSGNTVVVQRDHRVQCSAKLIETKQIVILCQIWPEIIDSSVYWCRFSSDCLSVCGKYYWNVL